MCGFSSHGVGPLDPNPSSRYDPEFFIECEGCHHPTDRDDVRETETGGVLCPDCAVRDDLVACQGCGRWMSVEEVIAGECLLCRLEDANHAAMAADREARRQELVNFCFEIMRTKG